MSKLKLTPYTFGTMSLGGSVDNFDRDIKTARAAMESGVSFHTSQEYGKMSGSFTILRHAFDQAPSQKPNLIAKIRCDRHELITYDIENILRTLNIEKVHCAQLCKDNHEKREIVEDFINEGPMFQACSKLKERGLVENFIMEVFTPFSKEALKALQNKLFDTFIFYYNFYERQTSDELFDAMQNNDTKLISMRLVHGGIISPERALEIIKESPGKIDSKKIETLIELYKQTNCKNFIEFSMRFIHGSKNFVSCVGGTTSQEHLQDYIDIANNLEPLPQNIQTAVANLLRTN